MTSRFRAAADRAAGLGPTRIAAIAVTALALLLVGCSKKEKGASQTAAKVNKEEITVHQINFMLQQQRGLKPEQTDAASKQILERLIDQELAVQKAEDMKLDRDPRVVQQIEAARRDIIARAYVDKVGEAAQKPTAEEIKKYYDDHPALFKNRRVYSLQELAIEAKPEQVAALRQQLQNSKSINEFVEFLKSNNYHFAANQSVRQAEQLPLNMLDAFSKLQDGQAMLIPAANGAQVVVLAGSRSEPVDETHARAAIEQYLGNDAKRKLVEADVKAMRAGAKIEYVGQFAQPASAPAAADTAASATSPEAVVQPPTAGVTTPVAPAAPASGLDASAINKGMGLSK